MCVCASFFFFYSLFIFVLFVVFFSPLVCLLTPQVLYQLIDRCLIVTRTRTMDNFDGFQHNKLNENYLLEHQHPVYFTFFFTRILREKTNWFILLIFPIDYTLFRWHIAIKKKQNGFDSDLRDDISMWCMSPVRMASKKASSMTQINNTTCA